MRPTSLLPRGKAERHLLRVFASCALLPLGALAILSARDEIVYPAGDLRIALPLAILLALCLVSLLAIRRIHQRLAPLERLVEGTRRIAEREADVRLVVDSGDEFEELAGRFNAMAGHLGEQLDALDRLVDVGRDILAAVDSEGIVSAVLSRIREVHPSDSVALTLVRASDPGALQTFVDHGDKGRAEVVDGPGFTSQEVRQLAGQSHHQLLEMKGTMPRCLEPLARAGMAQCLVLPLFVKEKLAGLIALGHRDAGDVDRERIPYARQLADQTALALGNAVVREENRLLAYYDSVTDLPNRRMYKDRLKQALHYSRRRHQLLATCSLNIDGFKRINDTLGFDGGDRFLREVGKRLGRCIRFTDAVARAGTESYEVAISRLGGDDFSILLPELSNEHDASRVARRVQKEFSKPFVLDGRELFTTASIGIAIYPFDGEDAETLLRNADTAMHCAKRRGCNNYQFFAKSMNAEASRKLHLEARMRRALERGEFSVHYQPVHEVATGNLAAAEALLRWDDPDMGMVRPDEFIPVAEETGLITTLGAWVLQTACAQCREWEEAGLGEIRMAVNLSGHQLRVPKFVETVSDALESTGLPPRRLELEITESTIMQDDDLTIAALNQLHRLGVGLALDDFGTGYSSLSYLRRFPIHRVKIDRSFVKEIPANQDDGAITAAIIAMAHNLRLGVVAEGVETDEQLEFLRERGCDEVQGFLFSPAVAAEEFSRFLQGKEDEPRS